MSTSEQLERETQEERARIAETLDELRARMTPGHVVDRLVDYATETSGGAFFRNLRQQAVDNPVPIALVGAGLAWFALAGRRQNSIQRNAEDVASRTADGLAEASGEVTERMRHAADAASDTASRWTSHAKSAADDLERRGRATATKLQGTVPETADSVRDNASAAYTSAAEIAEDASSRVGGAARSAADSVAKTTSKTYDAAADQARRAGDRLQKSASDMRGKVSASGRSIMDFVHEQPLVLVGLGLAIGAAIGAASPRTETEDELMGEASDAVKGKASDLATEQMEKGEAVAERAWASAKDKAAEEGLVSASKEDDGASAHLVSGTETTLVPSSDSASTHHDERSEH
jgi:ElaB/YqjD/DUF883 family membrane-anchored ribosome-binding protein